MLSTRSLLRRTSLAAVATLALTGGLLATPVSATSEDTAAYIVVLHDSVERPGAVAEEHRREFGAQVRFTYTAALKGYAAQLSRRSYAEVVRDRRVAYVEADGVATATAEQANATWGLDRTDQRALPLTTTYSYETTGSGVTAYVLDTGIRSTHAEFVGRMGPGFDAVTSGGSAEDCNGHGTHVAGTIGGSTYGVAKAVTLVPVRVLDCSGSGSWSGVIAGIDYVTKDTARRPAVANMSLGGAGVTSVDNAVRRSIAAGVGYAVAAGNGNMGGVAQDACKYSPARVTEAMTISATTKTDAKTSWANYGSCVDWFAPGAGITSAWHTSTTATNTISGTSMATPHSAGAAALLLETSPALSSQALRDALFLRTTKSIVTSSKTGNNHLLYSLPPG